MSVPSSSSTNVPTNPSDPPAYTDDDARALFEIPAPPSYGSQVVPLCLPLCVPQMGTGIDTPFCRAYCSELSASNIEQADWLKFCDGLNIALAASPPLRVLDAAGMIIGFVPYHWVTLAGPLIQVGAQVGAHVLSKGLTDRYLRIANDNFFAPRGLRARLCKTAAMRQIIGLDPTQASGNETLKTIGNMAERLGLRLPIIRRAIVMLHPVPTIDTSGDTDVTQRRVQALQGRVLPLDYDMPPPVTPPGVMDKMAVAFMKMDKRKHRKPVNQTDKARQLLAEQQASNSRAGRSPPPGGALGMQLVRDVISDKLSPGSRGGESTAKARTEVAIAERREVAKTVAVLWIVVLNEKQDERIPNTELMDSKADIEEIPESEWELVLRQEDHDDMQKSWEWRTDMKQ